MTATAHAEQKLLNDLDDARLYEKHVKSRWRFITWGLPVSASLLVAGIFGSGLLVSAFPGMFGGVVVGLILMPCLLGAGCLVWFRVTCPRVSVDGLFADSSAVRPQQAVERVRTAERRYREFLVDPRGGYW